MHCNAPVVLLWLVARVAGKPDPVVIRQDFGIDPATNDYSFNIELGTPPQMLTVNLDFASADLIVRQGANPCLETTCSWLEHYNAVNLTNSRSLHTNNSFISAPLASDGSIVSGWWVTDNVRLGNLGSVLVNDTCVLLKESSTSMSSDNEYNSLKSKNSLFGLGPRGLEATVTWISDQGSPGPTYDNLLYKIPGISPTFSVWVDPNSHTRGTLILGGIDESMYVSGSLRALPIAYPAATYGGLTEPVYLGVPFYGMSMVVRDDSSSWKRNYWFVGESIAILNSRARFSLPLPMLKQVGSMLSAEWASTEGMYLVRCDVQGVLSLDLGSYEFNVTLQNHLKPMSAVGTDGAAICGLNIGEADQVLLSNSVLREHFIAVDYSANTIAFGVQSPGPDSGQPQREHALNGTLPTVSVPELGASIDPYVSIYATESQSATIPGPQFAQSQTYQFVLGSEPQPSVLNADNFTANSSIFTGSKLKNAATASSAAQASLVATLLTIFAAIYYSS